MIKECMDFLQSYDPEVGCAVRAEPAARGASLWPDTPPGRGGVVFRWIP